MGRPEMSMKEWREIEELEKGTVPVVTEQVEVPRRDKYSKIIAILLLLILTWQYVPSMHPRQIRPARKIAGVPQFVLDYAPLVWLDEDEEYWPSDMYAQIENTHPEINRSTIDPPPSPLTLHNLDILNDYGREGMNVFLTSNIDITTFPRWLNGIYPNNAGKTEGAISCAIVINDRGDDIVDAFYMYFYAYNLGNTVFSHELGDHIGDWEHNMIRFQNSTPQAIWYSQHGNGQAFTYEAVEKEGKRPITYSAFGSHANYAVEGLHDHTIPDLNLPRGFLLDYTSQGNLWDPTLSTYFYNYHAETASFNSINESPLGAMHFRGRWGDQQYPDADSKQPPPFFGFRKFVSGPTGPWDKSLNRSNICPDNGIPCIVRTGLGP